MSSGMLDQFLTVHRAAGGLDPRSLTREEVAAMGVHTASTARQKITATDKSPACWRYVRAMERQRESKLPRQVFLAERKRLCKEFSSLSEEEKSVYVHNPDADDAVSNVGDPDKAYFEKIKGRLWYGSDRKQPIRAGVIEAELNRHVPPTVRTDAKGQAVPYQQS